MNHANHATERFLIQIAWAGKVKLNPILFSRDKEGGPRRQDVLGTMLGKSKLKRFAVLRICEPCFNELKVIAKQIHFTLFSKKLSVIFILHSEKSFRKRFTLFIGHY